MTKEASEQERQDKIKALELSLHGAILMTDYEAAAKLRDEIRLLEREQE